MLTSTRRLSWHVRRLLLSSSSSSSSQFSTSTSTSNLNSRRVTIGLRREDPSRIWERRCPLTPAAVERLVNEDGYDVLVQPCERRVFGEREFVEAGATIHPTLAPADVILGIKESPLDEILTDPVPAPGSGSDSSSSSGNPRIPRSHIMFSHTHKGQEYNAPLLSRFLASFPPRVGGPNVNMNVNAENALPTLIDWELLTDANGKRTVGFGWFAGVAGALEGLVSTSHLHLHLGVASPFLGTPRPHTAPLPLLLQSMKRIGRLIAAQGTPPSMGPFIVVVTGSGQVSAGALSLLRDTLPIQDVTVETLPKLIRDPSRALLNKIYLLHATQETYIFNQTTGERATRDAYYANPGAFESRFHELIAPYTTLLINGVGWTPGSPRLMTVGQTVSALTRVHEIQQEFLSTDRGADYSSGQRDVMKGRCQSYADVSCDIEGGLQFLTRASTLSSPSYTIDLQASFPNLAPPTIRLPTLQMMSVDILPTALPLEASQSFSEGIVPYVRAIAKRYRSDSDVSSRSQTRTQSEEEKEIQDALERATIASGGRLRERHTWLKGMVDRYRNEKEGREAVESMTNVKGGVRPERKKRILLLGSGMVAGPAVDEICRRKDVELIIASDQASRNAFLCEDHTKNASSVTIDMSRRDEVAELIKKVDVVISLLPVPLHPAVAELCVKHHRHLVTASYISQAMQALHSQAISSNVLLLNEIGLDPGIDHCSAFALLSSLRREGKNIVSFTSFCGGLPAPECADVPLRYKFSWSPRGVLSAALNGAHFLLGGKSWTIPREDLLRSNVPRLPVSDVLQLEGLPNRDSLSYSSTYDLHTSNGLQTLFRGTLRYPGFSELLLSFKQLGLLDPNPIRIESYTDLIRTSIERLVGLTISTPASLKSAIRDLTGTSSSSSSSSSSFSSLLSAIDWLSTSQPDERGMPSPPAGPTPTIDLFAALLAHKLAYKEGERDLVVLHHEIITSSPSPPPPSPSLTSPPSPPPPSPSLTYPHPHPSSPSPSRTEIHTSSLTVYGTLIHSAMALCVGVPVALAALRILDGGYVDVGVRGPDDSRLYEYVLGGMEGRGLRMRYEKRNYEREGEGSVEGRLREVWK